MLSNINLLYNNNTQNKHCDKYKSRCKITNVINITPIISNVTPRISE